MSRPGNNNYVYKADIGSRCFVAKIVDVYGESILSTFEVEEGLGAFGVGNDEDPWNS